MYFDYAVPEQAPAVSRVRNSHTSSGKAHSAQVLLNSPRAMPLSGYELVRPELTCKEDV